MRLAAILLLASLLAGCIGDTSPDNPPTAHVDPEVSALPSTTLRFPAESAQTGERRDVTWRVVEGTGNCCENYVATTASGRILDFGGTFLQFSDDDGRTWWEVPADLPYDNGEGAVAAAPGGDIVGIGWAPYTGDQLWAHKYEASTDTWWFNPILIHTPFYDREWIVAIPGPFEFDGEEVPYITIARGGWPYKDLLLFSPDGLNYYTLSSPEAEGLLATHDWSALDMGFDKDRDWIQPVQSTLIVPIGDGRALMNSGCPWLLDESMRWGCADLRAATVPEGRLLADSRGGLHVIDMQGDRFAYHISHDGGRSWDHATQALPPGMTSITWDFKAHAALDQTVVAIHAADGTRAQDLAFRFHGLDDTPWLSETLYVGQGGGSLGTGGPTASDTRFDFMSTAFLPDGRIVMSFLDASLDAPALAIELP